MTAAEPGLVIVGASLAGLRAAESARREGYDGPIDLVGSEVHLPYDRPPLSKAFLDPEGRPDFHTTADELARDRIRVHLGVTATAVDPAGRTVTTDAGVLAWRSLVIATGAAPRRLPSMPELPGVRTLRTLDDAIALRSAITPDAHVVVVGAGFIGSEIASSAHERGATVTVVEAAPVPLVRAVGETVGVAIAGLHGRNGVRLLCGTQIVEVHGTDRVTGVRLSTGETLPADLIVVGVGAAPATAWLAGSGIELHPVDGGIVCDPFLATSLPGVWAAGDVTHWPNAVMDATMRLENWTNAADQGTCAGINATLPERARPFETVPYFWSDWYGNRIQFVGTATADSVVFASGSPDSDRFAALYRVGDRVVGAATLNEQRKTMKLRRAIAQRATWEAALGLASAQPAGAVA